MNETDGIVRAQVGVLMQLLEQSRDSQCKEALEQAEAQANALRRSARKLARERVSRAAHEERERHDYEVRMVEAEIETEQRKRARRRDLALIEAGRGALREALGAQWRERDARQAWAKAMVSAAAEVLLGREWLLEHPADWPAEECDAVLAYVREHCDARIEAKPVDELDAGLRIRSAGALVDMSIPGLLANQRTIEGELLAEFNRVAGGEKS